jgi:hypothetical protein
MKGRNTLSHFFEPEEPGGTDLMRNITVADPARAIDVLQTSGFFVDERAGDFLTGKEEERRTRIKVVGFRERVTYEMAIFYFKNCGFRPTTFGGLSSFGLEHKGLVERLIERQKFLAALDSQCVEFDRTYIPFLGKHFRRPAMLRHWINFGFGPFWRFLIECE